MEAITELLVRWGEGDQSALDQVVPLVYDELHKIARAYLRREHPNQSIQPTALVNDLYLKLTVQHNMTWHNRAQFFGLAATLMRNILVDHARRRLAIKRGGTRFKVSLSHAGGIGIEDDFDILALHLALEDLTKTYPKHSRIVELRYFGGLTIEETAFVVGLAPATVERHWEFARALLRQKLKS